MRPKVETSHLHGRDRTKRRHYWCFPSPSNAFTHHGQLFSQSVTNHSRISRCSIPILRELIQILKLTRSGNFQSSFLLLRMIQTTNHVLLKLLPTRSLTPLQNMSLLQQCLTNQRALNMVHANSGLATASGGKTSNKVEHFLSGFCWIQRFLTISANMICTCIWKS